MERTLKDLEAQKQASSRKLMDAHNTEDVGTLFKTVSSIGDPSEKIQASQIFAETKEHSDQVKWMSGLIKKEKQERLKLDKERRLAELQQKKDQGGPAAAIILGLLGLGACGVMGFYPFPQ